MTRLLFYISISIHAPSRERPGLEPRDEPREHFNPRSLAGATALCYGFFTCEDISIHAPSRERQRLGHDDIKTKLFQSTLPRGSDADKHKRLLSHNYFNPRSLAGATALLHDLPLLADISIHAPSRERRLSRFVHTINTIFQSTLPRGSDKERRKQSV